MAQLREGDLLRERGGEMGQREMGKRSERDQRPQNKTTRKIDVAYVHVYMYIYIYICIYTHTYTHI